MNETTIVAAVLFVSSVTAAAVVAADSPLFPTPLHISREIDDPVSGRTHTVEEYYAGNRAISVSGERVAISDYAAGTLTEIDHAAGTWSVTRFESIAAARAALRGSTSPRPPSDADHLQVETVTPRRLAGRVAETLGATFDRGELRRIEVSYDPQIELSREAVEVIIGAAWPNEPGPASRASVAMGRTREIGVATSDPSARAPRYRLPLGQVLEYVIDGERLRVETRAVIVDAALPPTDRITIPSDAQEVENHLVRMHRLSEELDRLPGRREPGRR
jgi:hypothetical protein